MGYTEIVRRWRWNGRDEKQWKDNLSLVELKDERSRKRNSKQMKENENVLEIPMTSSSQS